MERRRSSFGVQSLQTVREQALDARRGSVVSLRGWLLFTLAFLFLVLSVLIMMLMMLVMMPLGLWGTLRMMLVHVTRRS